MLKLFTSLILIIFVILVLNTSQITKSNLILKILILFVLQLNYYINFFKIKYIFKRNLLIVEFELFKSIKVYFVFYTTFVNYTTINSLSK